MRRKAIFFVKIASALQVFQSPPTLFQISDLISFISNINKNANSSAPVRVTEAIPPKELMPFVTFLL